MIKHPFLAVPRSVKVLASAAALLVAASHVHAQTPTLDYGTDFDGTNNGTTYNDGTAYVAFNPTLGAPELSGQGTWTTNDVDAVNATPNYTGGNNGVFTSPQFSGNTGQLYGSLNGGYPGAPTVYLGHTFTMAAVASTTNFLSFSTDFTVTKSTNGHNDSFGFTLFTGSTTGSNGVALLSLTFAPEAGQINNQAVAEISVGGDTPTETAFNGALLLGQYSHLTINVDVNDGYAEVFEDGHKLFGLTDSRLVGANFNGIAGTLNVGNTLTDGALVDPAYINAGDNALIIDNFSVSQVPEPSTYAMIGLGALALTGVLRHRRKQA